jgi:hypothetical protein
MKKTIITAMVAVAAFGFSGNSFAGIGNFTGGGNGSGNSHGNPPSSTDIEATITRTVTFSPTDITKTIDSNNLTVGDIVAAVSVSSAPAYAAAGDLAVATANAYQEQSFPALTTVVTPIVGLSSAAMGAAGAGTDGVAMGAVTVSGAVGSGVGANIGGAVFESINTATAIAINGGMNAAQ